MIDRIKMEMYDIAARDVERIGYKESAKFGSKVFKVNIYYHADWCEQAYGNE